MAGLTILGIHGLGDHRADPWAQRWQLALGEILPDSVEFDFQPFSYDDIFERIEISPLQALRALAKLVGSGLLSSAEEMVAARGVARGPLDSVQHWLRWYAGYVVAWVENDQFRHEVRQRFLDELAATKPEVILAHSLGSLIAYDALTDDHSLAKRPALRSHLAKKAAFVSLGSQIGNPFVVRNLGAGRVVMPRVQRWFHLFNAEDDVFTAAIRLPAAPGFLQVTTFFDVEGMADHDAIEYLTHRATVSSVWDPLVMEHSTTKSVQAAGLSRLNVQMSVGAARGTAKKPQPRQRALLIGINAYPNPADQLNGCVNDVYLMSSVIQECGIPPEQIRVVLNERATAAGIRSRLAWLVDGAAPGDTLVLYFSGHGAQLPVYGRDDEVDRLDETLVPYDFDWSLETAVTDDQIYDLYSQLPYETRLVMIFDCCHSGGLYRDGGPKARGLAPPDDIRHRSLQWDATLSMWIPRKLTPKDKAFAADDSSYAKYFGQAGVTARLGRASRLRGLPHKEYAALKKENKGAPTGPYLPVILEACGENQLAFEYRHGAESYGAFTFSLAELLRRERKISFANLVKRAAARLEALGYDQSPVILGPSALLKAYVPWSDAPASP
jgi:hypothetical protein